MIKNTLTNYFIAETAFHHEGNVEFLEKLVGQLLELDIQAVKFHLLFDVDDYMVHTHSAIQVIRDLSIPESNWTDIFQKVNEAQKDIVALTNDVTSLKFINRIQKDYPIQAIELHSTGLNDLFLLREALEFKKTVILGTGGSTFDEIQFAVDFLKKNGKEDILLMHGFQNYPTDYEDINFKRIGLMRQAFNLPIGYADHTDPNDENNAMVSILPAMLGVTVFEKHVTHVYGEKRVDAQAAISLDAMKEVIILGNEIQKTLGTKNINFSEAELNYGNTGPMKKALVARKDLKKGTIVQLDDLAYKRTDDSSPLSQKDIFKIVGSEVIVDLSMDELISYEKIKYIFKKQSNKQFFIKK
jgi:N,N'-diacetyllegionaminate synthase